MSSLGRNGLIGFGIGVTVSTGMIAFLIIKEMMRRRSERHLQVSRSSAGFAVSSAAVDGRINLEPDSRGEEYGWVIPSKQDCSLS